jgi:hypothetical protein
MVEDKSTFIRIIEDNKDCEAFFKKFGNFKHSENLNLPDLKYWIDHLADVGTTFI